MSNQVAGIFEPNGKSGGFVRDPAQNYRVRPTDLRVPDGLCRELGLRGGEGKTPVMLAEGIRGRGGG